MAGATVSTVVLAGPLVLPAGSWATALTTVPLASGVPGVKVQLPLPSARVWPIGLPLPSVRITRTPGSAVPLSSTPLLGSITGVAGATASTVVLTGPLVLPAASWATALITVPLVSGVPGVKLQLPLPSAVACPIGLPPPSVRITVAPASAVPLITVPLLGSSTGVAGATESTVVLAGPLVLPAASWASALITEPLASGVPGVKLQLPLPSAVTWPIGLPLPSVRITVAPASAVPLMTTPLLGLITGAGGAMASTVTLAGPLVLPAGSWATALITVPLASGVLGVNVQLPLPSAVAWPIGLPPPSVRITVAPASAVPAITLPLLGSITGAAGATESTVVLAGPLVLPAASWATALTTVPLDSGVAGVKAQLPLPSAVTWPIGLPLPSVRITVAPASAVPAITLPLLGSITGAAGASESTVALVGLLLLPAASWASALITVPLANGVAGVKAQLPLPSAVTWPIGLPLPSVRITVAPASAVPLMTTPLLGLITGAGGAMASTVTLAGPLVLPAGSWATALITVPLASGVLGVNVQLPLPSAVAWPIGLPPPSVRITVAPASAVPLISVPLLGSITGAAGATPSTVITAGALSTLLGLRATTLTTVPSGSGMPGVKDQLPLPSAVTWPIGLPLPSVMMMVLPASAVPLITEPLLGSTCGIDGSEESTVVVAGRLVLPAASLAVTLTTVPLGSCEPGVKLQLPLPSAVVWPIGLPLPSVKVTVLPGSAVPLSRLPLLGLTTGVFGATASTVVLPCGPVLPAGSWATALTTVPLASGVAGVKVQLPLPSAVVSPIGLPLPSVRITLAPASAVPLMVVPLLGSITGAGGATASTVVAACGPVLPVGSVAVATITVPLASGVPGVKLQLPLPSAVTCPIGLPPASVRVTVAPASAVPLMTTPLLGLITGAGGALESTVTVAGGLLLPAASWATTLTTVPLAIGVDGV